VVDDFGVQYVGAEHAQHLVAALETDYTVSKDWTGGLYCGITLNWDYANKHVDLSMPGYIKDALHKLQNTLPRRPQYAPYNWMVPAYGQHIHYAPLPDASRPATVSEITRAQVIVGTLLYNARVAYPMLLVPLSALASQLSTATTTTIKAVSHILDYCSTHLESTIRYFASDMQLKIHSDASYLSEPKAKSRIGGYFFLGGKSDSRIKLSPMALSCATQQSSNMWPHLSLKLNFGRYMPMQKRAPSRAPHYLRWVTTRTPLT
jgi:hypothetical protein